MSRNIFESAFNLPPGCSLSDIDRAVGEPDTEICKVCGDESSEVVCPRCKCKVCDGRGHVNGEDCLQCGGKGINFEGE